MDPLIPATPRSLAMKTLYLLLIGLGVVCSASAHTINWGNSVGDSLFDSKGNPLDDSYTFELGSFGSFLPTDQNMDLWQSNWKVFDRASTANGGWSSSASFFSGSANLNFDSTSSSPEASPSSLFNTGEQAYIWAFNTQVRTDGFTEWALITNTSLDGNTLDNWTFPSATDHEGLPLEWRLSSATVVNYGGLNNVQGPGDHTANPGSFDLQTHSVIPEPGSGLLLLALGTIWRLRRNPRSTTLAKREKVV